MSAFFCCDQAPAWQNESRVLHPWSTWFSEAITFIKEKFDLLILDMNMSEQKHQLLNERSKDELSAH